MSSIIFNYSTKPDDYIVDEKRRPLSATMGVYANIAQNRLMYTTGKSKLKSHPFSTLIVFPWVGSSFQGLYVVLHATFMPFPWNNKG
jgi:hypothetical protein